MPTPTSALGVRAVRAFTDNYIWLIEAPENRLIAVDPGEAAPVRAELERSGSSLAAILLTHHHPDHIGGVAELLADGPRASGGSGRQPDSLQPTRPSVRATGASFQTWDLGSIFCTCPDIP